MTPTPLPARCHPCPLRVMLTPCPARCHSHTFSWVPPISLLLGMLTLPSHLFGYHPCLYSWVAPTLSPNPPGISHVPSLRWHQPPPSSPPVPNPSQVAPTSLLLETQPHATHVPSPGWYQPPPSSSPHPHSWLGATCSLLGTPTLSPHPAMCHLCPFSWMAAATSLLFTPSTLLCAIHDTSPG